MGCPYHHDDKASGSVWHDAEMDFSQEMSYGDYLDLDRILNAQHPRSPDHNEMLFIIQHQTSELWMKLVLHELNAARQQVKESQLALAFKMLARVSRILDQLVQAWTVLSTMTPPEYSAIRPYLGYSSGFQSYQYREIEFILGNKNPAMLKPHAHDPALLQRVEQAMNTASIYDEAIHLMARQGFAIDPQRLQQEPAWLQIYQQPQHYWDLYQLAEKFIDIEDAFRQWRFRHVTTVERVIGFKQGTGGTAGVSYLRKMLDTVLFPELWHLRSVL